MAGKCARLGRNFVGNDIACEGVCVYQVYNRNGKRLALVTYEESIKIATRGAIVPERTYSESGKHIPFSKKGLAGIKQSILLLALRQTVIKRIRLLGTTGKKKEKKKEMNSCPQ